MQCCLVLFSSFCRVEAGFGWCLVKLTKISAKKVNFSWMASITLWNELNLMSLYNLGCLNK